MAEITVNKISTDIVENYTPSDLNLVPSFDVISQFNPETDTVEFSIYNEQNLLEYINPNYTDYTVTLDYNTQENAVSSVNVDPEGDLVGQGYDQGNYTVIYNFFRNQISSSASNPYYIKEISSDRKEIRIANNNISNIELEELVNNFKTELDESLYFEDFEVNFGNNNIFLANNIIVDNTNESQYTVLIKLYESLDTQFSVKDTLTIILQTAEEVSYGVNFPPKSIPNPTFKNLRGPNFNLAVRDKIANSTSYKNQNSLLKTVPNNGIWTGSLARIKGILKEKGITPNVDYSDFNNFIYFSSAEQRVRNFYYKVSLIQDYSASIAELNSIVGANTPVSGNVAFYQTKINEVLENLDEYEKYQYHTSGSSDLYPKLNSTPPFTLVTTESLSARNWLDTQSTSGSEYDFENPDRAVNSLPSYVQDDIRNNQFLLFMDMIGQHFDNIWVYTKDIGNRFDADNRLTYGISKDVVADAIKSMGVNLYQNNFTNENLYSAFTLLNSEGSGSVPPISTEKIEDYININYDDQGLVIAEKEYKEGQVFYWTEGTADPTLRQQNFYVVQDFTTPAPIGNIGQTSYLTQLLGYVPTSIIGLAGFETKETPVDDVNKEIYKRIFHNLPLLLKQKGSIEGLRTLINTYGIPDSILRISEFGGKDKNNLNDYDYFQNTFNYSLTGTDVTLSSTSLNSDFGTLNNVSFRFKYISGSLPADGTSLLFSTIGGNNLNLEYTGGGFVSASYSGSIPSASVYEGVVALGGTEVTASFFNGEWWTIGVEPTKLRIGTKIYDGNDGFKVGFTASEDATITLGSGASLNGSDSKFAFQELRLYNKVFSDTQFNDFVMNPFSTEGDTLGSSKDQLAFRAPLGSELDIENTSLATNYTSVHPAITGSAITQSFTSNSNYQFTGGEVTYVTSSEFIYVDQSPVGIKNRIKEKVRSEDVQLPYNGGNTLSNLTSIQQNYSTKDSGSYTKDINLLEVAFSPQNEINDDINNSFGYFNIGEYIGDPRQISESVTSYSDLDNLRDSYFQKYYASYDWKDYIRLIKYFDNSLFKMIKDFAPAKSSLATGVVIKQHLLERNKQKPAAVETSLHDYSGSIESGFASGSGGGVFNDLNNVSPQVTQIWHYETQTLSGSLIVTQSTQDEFYNGELSGSEFTVEDGELVRPIPPEYIQDSFALTWKRTLFNTGDGNVSIKGNLSIIGNSTTQKITHLTFSNTNSAALNGINKIDYFRSLVSGDTLTLKVTSDSNGVLNVPSTPRTFTIVSISQFPVVAPGFGGWRFEVEHNWELEGVWSQIVNDFPDAGFGSGNTILYYSGEPIGSVASENNYLLNNADNSRKSIIYEDVDYTTNITKPLNYDLIKNGNAVKAPVQDSNYSKKSWTNSRYNGTRISSLGFNIEIQR